MRNPFFVIEGVDGSGTTTQSRRLASWLKKRSVPCLVTCEPSKFDTGRHLRSVLAGNISISGPAWCRNAALADLFVADRVEHVRREIIPAIKAGKVVVCDRYSLSTIAYQGAGGMDMQSLVKMHSGIRKPDLTIFLKVSAETAAGRLKKRKNREMFENSRAISKSIRFYEKAIKICRELRGEKIVVIDAQASALTVEKSIREIVGSRLGIL